MKPVRIGCSGWNYRHWKEPFYEGRPARVWLEHYAEHFDTVEVNATFYRLPTVKGVQGWVDQTPDGFLFSVKASRYLTHIRRLPRGRHCVELRHESWFHLDVYSILSRHRAALVIGDAPNRPFQTRELTAAWTYVRLHHGSRGRNGNYSDAELDEWLRRIARWRSSVEVFAYFNNDWAMASSARNFRPYKRFARAFGKGESCRNIETGLCKSQKGP